MGAIVDYKNKKTVDNLDTIYITGAGYINRAFKGVGRDSAWGWEEPVFGGNLTRSTNLVLQNIDTVNFGLVARVELNFKYMNISDYIALCQMAKQRTVMVNFFNRETGERQTQEMAFTENSIGQLYAFRKDKITNYLGILDVSIKLVATNRDKENLINTGITISYDSNGGTGSISSQSATWSDEVKLSDGEGFTKSGEHIKEWNTSPDSTGSAYGLSQRITVWKSMKLYAIWEAS